MLNSNIIQKHLAKNKLKRNVAAGFLADCRNDRLWNNNNTKIQETYEKCKTGMKKIPATIIIIIIQTIHPLPTMMRMKQEASARFKKKCGINLMAKKAYESIH